VDIADGQSVCDYVTSENATCSTLSDYFAYLPAYYCASSSGVSNFLLFLYILWLLYLISLLTTTADWFFVPPLKMIARQLKLTPEIAGVTLLAFAIGGTDVLSATSSLGQGDLSLAVSGLLGASVFISTFVLACIGLTAKETPKLNKWPFFRDVIAYIITTLLIIAMTTSSRIAWYEAWSFLFAYIIYVTVIFIQNCHQSRKQKISESPSPACSTREPTIVSARGSVDQPVSVSMELVENTSYSADGDSPKSADGSSLKSADRCSPEVTDGCSPEYGRDGTPEAEELVSKSVESMIVKDDTQKALARSKLRGLSWPAKKRWISKVFYIVQLPFSILRHLTIPPSDGHWDARVRIISVCIPVPCGIWMLYASVGNDEFLTSGIRSDTAFVPSWSLLLAIGGIISMLLLKFTSSQSIPKFYPLLQIAGLISAVLWMSLIADELVALLESIGVITSISTAILGLTVLAIGNSADDFVSDLRVAKKHSPHMAVAACFGGPMLNDCLGLGISLVLTTTKSFPQPYYAEISEQVVLGWIFLLISLVSSLVFIPISGFYLSKRYCIYLVVVYVVFLICAVLLELEYFALCATRTCS